MCNNRREGGKLTCRPLGLMPIFPDQSHKVETVALNCAILAGQNPEHQDSQNSRLHCTTDVSDL